MQRARLLRARLSGQHSHQRRIAVDQLLQRRLNIGEFIEIVKPFGASAKLTKSLRPAQQQHAKNSDFTTPKVIRLREPVFILCNATLGTAHCSAQSLIVESMQRLAYGFFVEFCYRLAI